MRLSSMQWLCYQQTCDSDAPHFCVLLPNWLYKLTFAWEPKGINWLVTCWSAVFLFRKKKRKDEKCFYNEP